MAQHNLTIAIERGISYQMKTKNDLFEKTRTRSQQGAPKHLKKKRFKHIKWDFGL